MPQQDFDLILRVQADLQQAVKQLRDLNDSMRVVKSSAQDASSGLESIGRSATAAQAGVSGIRGAMDDLAQRSKLMRTAFVDLRNVMIAAFAVHEVAGFVGGLADANVAAQRIQYTLAQVFGEQGASEQFEFVSKEAARLGLDLQSAAEGYATLAASAQNTGLSTKTLQKLFTALSESATVLHSSAQQVNGVMVQLAQGMSLGRLQMQDIRAISQNLPGTFTLVSEAAQRMGINFQDALAHGGIPAIQFLSSFADVLHERFGGQAVEASHSLNSELNDVKTTLFELKTDGGGFADAFAGALRNLNETLHDPAIRQGLQDLITDLGKIASLGVKAAGAIGTFTSQVGQGLGIALAQVETGISNPDDMLEVATHRVKTLKDTIAELQARVGAANANAGKPTWIKRVLGIDDGASLDNLNAKLAQLRQQLVLAEQAVKIERANPGGGIVPGVKRAPATPTTLGKAQPLTDQNAAKEAAKLAKQAAKAQDDLTQSLISMQAQLDTTAAAWATYNAAVKKATDEAVLAKKAKGADAADIDAQRDAVIALAGTIRDAALDKIAEQDRQAWEALKKSFETPAQVRVDDAIAKIKQLNKAMADGVGDASQYHELVQQAAQNTVAGAPTYSGIGASVGGVYGELGKNYDAMAALDDWHAKALAANEKFRQGDAASEEAYQAGLAAIDAKYAKDRLTIDRSRGELQLSAASELFGNLASLSSSHNKKMATIGKAAAIAQAVINTYQSATEAYAAMASIPYIGPALGAAAAAAAIVAGLANVAQIRSQNVGGYKGGGAINGPGTGTSDSIPILASNGEFMHTAAAVRYYGVPFMDAVNNMRLPKFAGGGLVAPSPMANVPSPVFAAQPRLPTQQLAAQGASDASAARTPTPKVVVLFDRESVMNELAQTSSFEQASVHVVSSNPRKIQGKWRGG